MKSDAAVERHPVGDRRFIVRTTQNSRGLPVQKTEGSVRCEAVTANCLAGDAVGLYDAFTVDIQVDLLLVKIDLGVGAADIILSMLRRLLCPDRLCLAAVSCLQEGSQCLRGCSAVHLPAVIAPGNGDGFAAGCMELSVNPVSVIFVRKRIHIGSNPFCVVVNFIVHCFRSGS